MAPCESPEQPTQFSLSGPGDCISTGVGCRSDENSQTSTTSCENSQGGGSTDLPRPQPEDQNPVLSTLTSGGRVADSCCASSESEEETLKQNGQVYSEETETKDRYG